VGRTRKRVRVIPPRGARTSIGRRGAPDALRARRIVASESSNRLGIGDFGDIFSRRARPIPWSRF